MAKLIHQAADKFFKQSMSRISVAKEFFAQHLPEGIYQKVNWSSLCLAKETFIDKSYKSYAADLVYQVDTTKAKKMYFYLLCEHQSKVDPWMAFRFLIYSIKVMEYHRKQYPESELPVVYPMVIYSGQAIWTATQDLFELFGEQASLARQYLTQYQVIDVCRLKDEELQQKILAGIMQYALKNKVIKELKPYLKVLMQWLDRLDFLGGQDYAISILHYMADAVGDGAEQVLFAESIDELSSEKLKDKAMTFAEQLRQEGFEKGKKFAEQFRQEGIEKGIEDLARNLIAEGLDINLIQRVTKFSLEKIQRLQADVSEAVK